MENTKKKEHTFLGSGWAFPVAFTADNLLLATSSNEANVNQSIDIILKTNRGERIMQPNFGSGLHQFLFRKMDQGLKGEIIEMITMSLLHHEPRISVKGVNVVFSDIVNGIIEIMVDYVYNQTNTRHNYIFPFHIKEGTNLG